MIHKTQANWRNRLFLLVLYGAGLLDTAIYLGSITFLCSTFRNRWLFSETAEKLTADTKEL